MPTTSMHSGRGIRREQRGAALIEFSLVFGLFVFVLYGLISFGMVLAVKQSITHAAADGARAAIGVVDDAATVEDERVEAARTRVSEALDWLGDKYEGSDTTATIGHCDGSASPSATCISVSITYPYEDRPLVPPAPGLGVVLPSEFATTAVVALSN